MLRHWFRRSFGFWTQTAAETLRERHGPGVATASWLFCGGIVHHWLSLSLSIVTGRTLKPLERVHKKLAGCALLQKLKIRNFAWPWLGTAGHYPYHFLGGNTSVACHNGTSVVSSYSWWSYCHRWRSTNNIMYVATNGCIWWSGSTSTFE